MIGYAVAFVAGGVFCVAIFALLAGASDRPDGDEPGLQYQCDSCGEPFRTVNAARQHAMTDHKAPDAPAADALVTEVIE